MKALIRNEGETVTDCMGVPGINWDTGYPLTASGWAGGPYVLVNDYVPEDPVSNFAVTSAAPASAQDPVIEEAAPDTIVIDGVKYARTT